MLRYLLAIALISAAPVAAAQVQLEKLRLPPGFVIEVFADGVRDARSLTLGDNGTVFVGTRARGTVYALVDADRDGKSDRMYTIAKGLNSPNGVAFRNGSLYVAEINRIIRYDGIEDRLNAPPEPVTVNEAFPSDRHHGWKFIAFGPDNKLYVPVGAPCNICAPNPDQYAVIMRLDADGRNLETFARGIRNSVGFDWHPQTKELWFNDHGRDWMGDDMPSDELNRAPKAGMHFGYPYCHQGDAPDPEFGHIRKCKDFTPPVLNQGGHVAPNGLRFYTGNMFPQEYRNRILIAQHGSWNRSKKNGYRLVSVEVTEGTVTKYEVFAEGWVQNEVSWGRPVDILVMPDGALLVSDDYLGVVYRITYQG
ncbi:MAG: sorbosone dehydrogenase family protein [Burkholderiales bacterium]|nr:sorbosone dehydrogenase family protein [Burkholderiales bacterium]